MVWREGTPLVFSGVTKGKVEEWRAAPFVGSAVHPKIRIPQLMAAADLQ